jgi:PadR family transcriptional regulator, regulatory protein PadR
VCDIQYNRVGGKMKENQLNKKLQELLESFSQELRRGSIIISVLSQLNEPQYGYSLVILLEEKGFKIDPGTLYPLLRRLEKQELLKSLWDTDGKKPRKYYQMTDLGKQLYQQLTKQWIELVHIMEPFIKE